MVKKLSEMTLQELWQLFPIELTVHREEWKKQYGDEYSLIKSAFPQDAFINHIGSTFVDGIMAKPIVDILAECSENEFDEVTRKLSALGYTLMNEENLRRDYNKGYTPQGFAEKVFHLHLRTFGDNNELYFRDFLVDNPFVASQYEKLKLKLWKKYEFDRDAYTNAKTDFISEYTAIAKMLYPKRYERFPGK